MQFYEYDIETLHGWIVEVLDAPEDKNFRDILKLMIIKEVTPRIPAHELCALLNSEQPNK